MTKQTEAASPIAENIDVEVFNVLGENGLDDTGAAAKATEQGYGIPQTENSCVISEDMAGTILKAPFAVAAAFWGEHWELSKGEVDLMAPPAARVFSELFGQWAGQYPDAYMLGFSLIMAVAPRAAQTAHDKKLAKKPVKNTEDDLNFEELYNAE